MDFNEKFPNLKAIADEVDANILAHAKDFKLTTSDKMIKVLEAYKTKLEKYKGPFKYRPEFDDIVDINGNVIKIDRSIQCMVMNYLPDIISYANEFAVVEQDGSTEKYVKIHELLRACWEIVS